jgi:hypothetical protein
MVYGKNTPDSCCKQLLYISLKTNVLFREQAITEGQFVAWYMEDELVVLGVLD